MIKWLLGTAGQARAAISRALQKVFVGTPSRKEGDKQGGMYGVESGGVAWPVDHVHHDGASFLSRDVFFAIWRDLPLDRHVRLLRKTTPDFMFPDLPASAEIHFGSLPLKHNVPVDEAGIFLAQDYLPRDQQRGIVIRGSEFGQEDLTRNFFLPIPGDIESLTWGEAASAPPQLFERSTDVVCPRIGRGRVNEALLVQPAYETARQKWHERPGGGSAAPTPITISSGELCSATLCMWNHPLQPVTDNHGQNSGHGIFGWTHGWAAVMNGLFSEGGPFIPLRSPRYLIGQAKNSTVNKGRTDWAVGGFDFRAKFSASEQFEGPLDLLPQYEPKVQDDDGFLQRVRCMFDPIHNDRPAYPTLVGDRTGYWRWHVPQKLAALPPADYDVPVNGAVQIGGGGGGGGGGGSGGLIFAGTPNFSQADMIGMADLHKGAL